MLKTHNEHGFCIVPHACMGVRGIFGDRFSRMTRFFRQEDEAEPRGREPDRRGRKWKRTLLLVPLLIGLFFAVVAEQGHPAAGKAGKGGGGILAALMSPLDLFAERSPGGRDAGPLLSTKPERTAALIDGPEERVLSGIRDRDPPVDGVPPGLGNPVFGIGPEDGPASSVASRTLPGEDPPFDGPGVPPFSSGPGQPLLGQAPTFLSDPVV